MEGAVPMPRKRREKEKDAIARAKTFPRTMSNSTSSEQAIDSVPSESIPTASYQTSQVELVKIDVDEPSPSEHLANETQTDETERDYYIRKALYFAALKDDWPSAKKIHKEYPDADIWKLPIAQQEMNTLQVAVAAKHTAFVNELLNRMTSQQLEFKNGNGDTALAIAALSGNVKIAKKMVEKNNKLPMIRNREEILPLITAAVHRQRDMVLYLFRTCETKFEELTPAERLKLLLHVIPCDMYEIADEILIKDPTLATAEDEHGRIALEELARKPFAIGSRSQMSAWERCIGYC